MCLVFLNYSTFFLRRLNFQKWVILRKEVWQPLTVNKARGSPTLVIINSRGHQFFNHSAGRWVPQHCSQTGGRGRKASGTWVTLDTCPHKCHCLVLKRWGKRPPPHRASVQGGHSHPEQQPGLIKMEVEGNWNGFLIFVGLAEHCHTPKANGLLCIFAEDFKEPFTKKQINTQVGGEKK